MDETLLAATYRKAGLYDQAHWYDTDYAGYLAENAFYENAVKKCIGQVRPISSWELARDD